MRVLGRMVLVEQTMTKKPNLIITSKTGQKNEDDYNYEFKVLQLGPECPTQIQEGDKPIFSRNVTFEGVKIIEAGKEKEVVQVIVHYDDIIAVE